MHGGQARLYTHRRSSWRSWRAHASRAQHGVGGGVDPHLLTSLIEDTAAEPHEHGHGVQTNETSERGRQRVVRQQGSGTAGTFDAVTLTTQTQVNRQVTASAALLSSHEGCARLGTADDEQRTCNTRRECVPQRHSTACGPRARRGQSYRPASSTASSPASLEENIPNTHVRKQKWMFLPTAPPRATPAPTAHASTTSQRSWPPAQPSPPSWPQPLVANL